MNIKETFEQFCKERHAEDKGRNFDLLQTIYASTEFFDTTLCHVTQIPYEFEQWNNKSYVGSFPIENLSTPFQNMFIQVADEKYIFLREYSPDTLTGTLYSVFSDGTTLNVPFTIKVKEDHAMFLSDFYVPLLDNSRIIKDTLILVAGTCMTLNELSKKSIAVDKPSDIKCQYYRRKRSSTIKVPSRPIYYVLGDKNEDVTPKYKSIKTTGNLEYSYSFHVRGHWRKLNEETFGKDRNNFRIVKGYTWVTEYTKGKGNSLKD